MTVQCTLCTYSAWSVTEGEEGGRKEGREGGGRKGGREEGRERMKRECIGNCGKHIFILVSCNICESSDTLQNVYKYLGSALGELYSKQYNNPNQKHKPSQQKSFTQPRFYATHKKGKIDSKSLSKPSIAETLLSQEALHDTETEMCGICFKEDKDCNSEINWVSCSSCWMWVHTQCADVPSNLCLIMSMYVTTVIHTPVIRKNFLFTLCTLNTVILYVTYNQTMLAKE